MIKISKQFLRFQNKNRLFSVCQLNQINNSSQLIISRSFQFSSGNNSNKNSNTETDKQPEQKSQVEQYFEDFELHQPRYQLTFQPDEESVVIYEDPINTLKPLRIQDFMRIFTLTSTIHTLRMFYKDVRHMKFSFRLVGWITLLIPTYSIFFVNNALIKYIIKEIRLTRDGKNIQIQTLGGNQYEIKIQDIATSRKKIHKILQGPNVSRIDYNMIQGVNLFQIIAVRKVKNNKSVSKHERIQSNFRNNEDSSAQSYFWSKVDASEQNVFLLYDSKEADEEDDAENGYDEDDPNQLYEDVVKAILKGKEIKVTYSDKDLSDEEDQKDKDQTK
eukprot:403353483